MARLRNRHPGEILKKDFLNPIGMSQNQLAHAIGVPGNRIHAIVSGTRAYFDEFTVALRDSSGRYRSWPAANVKVQADDPAEAHVELLAKYTDDDIHDLMTYLMTLK